MAIDQIKDLADNYKRTLTMGSFFTYINSIALFIFLVYNHRCKPKRDDKMIKTIKVSIIISIITAIILISLYSIMPNLIEFSKENGIPKSIEVINKHHQIIKYNYKTSFKPKKDKILVSICSDNYTIYYNKVVNFYKPESTCLNFDTSKESHRKKYSDFLIRELEGTKIKFELKRSIK